MISRALKYFWSFLQRVLLLPLLPALAWGPFSHTYINRLALEKARQALADGRSGINMHTYALLERNQDTYLSGANTADAISTYHLITNGVSIYDYAHNNFPDSARGIPLFGYRLIHEWKQAAKGLRGGKRYSEKDFALACGWLSHQIADWYAHYAVVNRDGCLTSDPSGIADGITTFEGYSNSHRVFGSSFYPEVLMSQTVLDHALTEFFYDMLIREQYGDLLATNPAAFFQNHRTADGKLYNLLTDTSELYTQMNCRIPPEQVQTLQNNFEVVISGMRILMEILLSMQPRMTDVLYQTMDPKTLSLPDYADLSAQRIVEKLFAYSDQAIANIAKEPVSAASVYPDVVVRDIPRAGTMLFGWAHRLGSLLDGNSLIPMIRSKENLNLRLLWGLFDLKTFSFSQLGRMLTSPRVREALPGASGRAVLAFLAELLRPRTIDFSTARIRYRELLPPVVSLAGPPNLSDADKIAAMLSRSEISLVFTPALCLEDPRSYPNKNLNPQTIVMRVDGYDANNLSSNAGIKKQYDDHGSLVLTYRLNTPLRKGFHHLFASVNDCYGIQAAPLDKEIHIRN